MIVPSPPAAKLSVVHLTTTIERGGAENYLVDLISGQIAAGYRSVTCAYLKGRPYWREALEKMGVAVIDLRCRSYLDPTPALRLRRELERRKPDVLHVHGAPAEVYAYASQVALREPPALILTRHEMRRRLFKHLPYRIFDRIIADRSDHVIAVSRAVRAADIARRPELDGKESVVHHGIYFDFADIPGFDRRSLRKQFGAGDDTVLIGTVARHSADKSIDTLLKAFAIAKQRLGKVDLRLALIGRGPLTSELKRLSASLGIEEQTAWFPFREDIAAVMRSLDVFAFPTVEEGFGIVLLEAMVCSLPVVACRVDAIPEIVEDGATGILVPPRDAPAMAHALERLAIDKELRIRLGSNGLDRIRSGFTTPAMQQKTLEVYAGCMNELSRRN